MNALLARLEYRQLARHARLLQLGEIARELNEEARQDRANCPSDKGAQV